MITVRKSQERGHAKLGWLDSRHTFSFSEYYDPRYLGFQSLRVINEDRVQARSGFGTHPHRDMEILTYVLDGQLEHRDSLGNGSSIRPGDLQRMSAGTGVMHSELNSSEQPVHFLQIWILPRERGLAPGYEQRRFPEEHRQGRLRLLASPDGKEGSVTVHQDASLYGALLSGKERLSHPLGKGRFAWVQVAFGELTVNGQRLSEGDGAALTEEAAVVLEGQKPSEVLLFDLG